MRKSIFLHIFCIFSNIFWKCWKKDFSCPNVVNISKGGNGHQKLSENNSKGIFELCLEFFLQSQKDKKMRVTGCQKVIMLIQVTRAIFAKFYYFKVCKVLG